MRRSGDSVTELTRAGRVTARRSTLVRRGTPVVGADLDGKRAYLA